MKSCREVGAFWIHFPLTFAAKGRLFTVINKMTEDEYYAGEFTDGELNCQADLAEYRRAAEEFYLEYRDQMDEEPERSSGDILRSHTAEH